MKWSRQLERQRTTWIKRSLGVEGLWSAARCLRCGRLMVVEQCGEFLDRRSHADFRGRRCVQYGEFMDPVILEHRRPGRMGR